MSKTTRNILIAVVIVLLIFGISLAVYSNFKSEPMNANVEKNNILDDANKGLENFINDIFEEDNNIENVANEENIESSNDKTNTVNTNTQNQEPITNQDSIQQVENQTTPGEKKALELVKEEWKKEWGNLKGVSFNNESIQGDGKYVISVNDSKTTRVIRRYVVDTDTGIVEEK